jgi:effector-binding domain-containing protein
MRQLFRILFGLALIAGALFAAGYYLLPPVSEISRSAEIARPASLVYPLLIKPRTYVEFAPWSGGDLGSDYAFDGEDEGVGAVGRWSGRAIGAGALTIVKTMPDKEVYARVDGLAFAAPGVHAPRYLFKFTLAPTARGAQATWLMRSACPAGPADVPCRYLAFIEYLRAGGQMQAGLKRPKTMAEALPPIDIAGFAPEIVDVEPRDFAFVEGPVPQGADAFRAALNDAFASVDAFLKKNDLPAAGKPLAVMIESADGKIALRAGEPFEGPAPIGPGEVSVGKTPGGAALKVLYTGPYDAMKPTYQKLDAYAKAHRLAPDGYPWEVYLDDPGATAPDQLRTEIYFPFE